MSGGAFEYNQRKIGYIADEIEQTIRNSGKEKTIEELKDQYGYNCDQWLEKYPEDKYHYQYPAEVLTELKAAVHSLRVAEIYAQRVDWLFSGDDGPETFIERLNEDLEDLDKHTIFTYPEKVPDEIMNSIMEDVALQVENWKNAKKADKLTPPPTKR